MKGVFPLTAYSFQTCEPDPCCAPPLQKAMDAGALDAAETWECPKCGCEWKPRMVGPIRHWEPHVCCAFV